MKRRNADCGKLRRPPKRNKITEGIYGSTFLYLKFLMVWALVLMADFILEFRFEYLWPFWLLLRSVYDSFKFQGLAFSVFFVCVAVTSDVICYLFIPVQWLFFASSTYVWVQYVWHTERGVCIPTICLWTLFVYMEASIRLSVVKSMPFHLDLCRPFAAHCIGYPVVTLGFGFKSYISYKMRVRKQKVVQKENEFYVQLLQQALPIEQQAAERQKALAAKAASLEESISTNGSVPNSKKTNSAKTDSENQSATAATNSKDNNSSVSSNSNHHTHSSAKSEQLTKKQHNSNHTSSSNNSGGGGGSNHSSSTHIEDYQYIEQSTPLRQHSVNDYDQENYINDQQVKAYKSNGVASSGSGKKLNGPKENNTNNSRKGKGSSAHIAANGKENLPNFTNNKEEVINGLEGVVKKLRTDLQSSRSAEQEMRAQLTNLMSGDKTLKNEVQQLRQDNESLQNKLHNLVTSRQQDKANLGSLESKLQDERKKRTTTEQQLAAERKAKKAEEQATARAMAMANAFRSECTESCKTQRRELETDIKQYKHDIKAHEEQIRSLEHEVHTLRQYKDSQGETDVLMSALSAMQDKNAHLENSLSAETRVKMDLFSALGDAKRQLEIQTGILNQRDQQICELKSKVAEVMALMPATASSYSSTSTMLTHSSPSVVDSPHFAAGFSPAPSPILSVPQPPTQPGQPPQQPPPQQQQPPGPGEENVLNLSSLNPNASDYTPKVTQ